MRMSRTEAEKDEREAESGNWQKANTQQVTEEVMKAAMKSGGKDQL